MKKVFIGIDFSKVSIDAAILIDCQKKEFVSDKFSNEQSGFESLLTWVESHTSNAKTAWLFCGEHTGLYSISLTGFMNNKGIDIWLEPGIQIKRSLGIIRSKNDKIDACNIALYAYRFKDRAYSTKLRNTILDQLKDLDAHSSRLKKMKHSLKVATQELKRIKDNDSVSLINIDSQELYELLETKIKRIDKQMIELICKESSLYENFKLLTSIKGIGSKNAIMIIVITGNFTTFDDPRKFGCYCGVVPFSNSSGSSLAGSERVSSLANKKMKTLLSSGAEAAIKYNPVLRNYYIKKKQEGKNRRVIINNVRNKLIHIMFAVIRNHTVYQENYEQQIKYIA